ARPTREEPADQLKARGDLGIHRRVDHTVDAEVEALFGRIEQEQRKLDIMVHNAWGGYQNNNLRNGPFWEQEMFRWDNMYLVGVRSHLLGSRLAAQIMAPRRQGLIVNTTVIMGDEYRGGGCMFYYAAKHA